MNALRKPMIAQNQNPRRRTPARNGTPSVQHERNAHRHDGEDRAEPRDRFTAVVPQRPAKPIVTAPTSGRRPNTPRDVSETKGKSRSSGFRRTPSSAMGGESHKTRASPGKSSALFSFKSSAAWRGEQVAIGSGRLTSRAQVHAQKGRRSGARHKPPGSRAAGLEGPGAWRTRISS